MAGVSMSDGAIPVAVSGFTWTAALVGLLNLLVGGVLVALVKSWPALKKLGIDENERLRQDRREDYRELRREFDLMKVTNSIIEKHCTAVDVRMGQLEFIVGLTFDELDRLDPNNEVARKGREMFGRLYPVPPISKELERIKEQLDPIQSPIPPRDRSHRGEDE